MDCGAHGRLAHGLAPVAVIVVALALGACARDDTNSQATATTATLPSATETTGTVPAATVIAPATSATESTQPNTTAAATAPATTTAPAVANAAVCDALGEVRTLSDEIGLLTSELLILASEPPSPERETETAAGLAQVADELEGSLPELLDSYARAEAVADPDIATDIAVLAEGTAALTPAIAGAARSASSFAELDDAITAAFEDPDVQDSAQQAALAAIRLDQFTVPECGFQLSNA